MTAPDRRRFIVAHAAVRHIVGRRVGVPAEQLRWSIGAHGKPEVRGTGEGLRVNLSHSGGLCMVAVTDARPVGVDIQSLVADATATALGRRYFPAAEARLVHAAPDGGGPAALFARLWARKEAVVKAAGTRLALGLAVPVHGACPLTVEMEEDGVPGSYRVTDVAAPEGYRAAVALAGDGAFLVRLHEWSWSGLALLPETGV
jgi:4'-phosphopantetheinyl transferase